MPVRYYFTGRNSEGAPSAILPLCGRGGLSWRLSSWCPEDEGEIETFAARIASDPIGDRNDEVTMERERRVMCLVHHVTDLVAFRRRSNHERAIPACSSPFPFHLSAGPISVRCPFSSLGLMHL